MTATSCLSTLTRRRRRNKPILESRLSKLIGAGSAEIRASMTCNYLLLPLAFPLEAEPSPGLVAAWAATGHIPTSRTGTASPRNRALKRMRNTFSPWAHLDHSSGLSHDPDIESVSLLLRVGSLP
jgi:hypothetical protein